MRYPEAMRLSPLLSAGHVIDMAQAVFGMLRSAPYRRWVGIGEGTHSVFMEKNRWQVFNAVDGLKSRTTESGNRYREWVRFVMPLIAKWFVICIGALIIGVWINWDRPENEAGQNYKEGSLPTCPNKSVPGCLPSAM
jgi:hypothetical protein